MARPRVVVAIVAGPGRDTELAEELADALPGRLGERFGGVDWEVQVVPAGTADPAADAGELLAAVRRRLLEEGWDLGIGLTDLPLRSGRRPVSAHASAAHGVGLVSIPALGAVGVRRRLLRAVTHLVEGLLGESVGEREPPGRQARMTGRLRELSSPLGRARVRDDGTVGFVSAVLRGNLRLLVGMIRANEPSKIVVRLSAALLGSLGTAAISLASSNIWQLADGMTWPRLLGLGLLSVVGTGSALVLAHGLWERAPRPEARERVMLFNLATTATLALGVMVLYLALFGISLAGGAALIPPHEFARQVGHPVGAGDYARLAWLVASLATIGGALGSLVDSDDAVREAAYRRRSDARTETRLDEQDHGNGRAERDDQSAERARG
jgi:hypothetical protein